MPGNFLRATRSSRFSFYPSQINQITSCVIIDTGQVYRWLFVEHQGCFKIKGEFCVNRMLLTGPLGLGSRQS